MMNTDFAYTERTNEGELSTEINAISRNPLVLGLLDATNGLLAVLDEQGSIVAFNDSSLRISDIEGPSKVLGLRPGEAIKCTYACGGPASCGSTEFCSTCGINMAIISSLVQDKPDEKICALTAQIGDKKVDIALLARCRPIHIGKKRFLLLFLQDITEQQQRAAVERTFFHDLNNIIGMLVGASELLVGEEPSRLAGIVHKASLRLMEEVAIQRSLLKQNETRGYQPRMSEIKPGQVVVELHSFFSHHPAANNKKIEFIENCPDVSFYTDNSLILRVLINIIINALEATEENGIVKMWIELEDKFLSFCVRNAGEIPHEVALRIFQRNFSTKAQAGRGLGTFSMKLFGEQILGGKVNFTTSHEEGTVFRFSIPL